jgi:protein TonB
MKKFFVILILSAVGKMFAQTASDTVKVDTLAPPKTSSKSPVLVFAEEMPQFPGDEGAFQKYLQENIIYPKSAVMAGKQGTVYVSFVVMKDGSIDSVRIERGVMNAPELDEEAKRVISAMPKWIPGKMNGKPVKIKMTVPIKFELQDAKKRRKKKKDGNRK